jgi:hypothetical protein
MREGSFVRASSALKSLESLEKVPRRSFASSASQEGQSRNIVGLRGIDWKARNVIGPRGIDWKGPWPGGAWALCSLPLAVKGKDLNY